MYEAPTSKQFVPSFFVDITEFLESKLASIRAHVSQVQKNRLVDLEAVAAQARYRGFEARIGHRYAEGFAVDRFVWDLAESRIEELPQHDRAGASASRGGGMMMTIRRFCTGGDAGTRRIPGDGVAGIRAPSVDMTNTVTGASTVGCCTSGNQTYQVSATITIHNTSAENAVFETTDFDAKYNLRRRRAAGPAERHRDRRRGLRRGAEHRRGSRPRATTSWFRSRCRAVSTRRT